MLTTDWEVLGYILLLAAPLAWLEIRHMARQDRNPLEALKWPEWWAEDARQGQATSERVASERLKRAA